jgi:phage terminase large subunit
LGWRRCAAWAAYGRRIPLSLQLAVDKVIAYRMKPSRMVEELFGHALKNGIDEWQRQVLDDFPTNPRQAMACCKGPGKTTVLAWLGWNFLLTRKFPRVKAVSITGQNLKDNLWAEMAKWQRESPMLTALFDLNADRIFLQAAPDTWYMARATFQQSANAEELGQTLAGTWSEHVLFLIDEAGGVPVPVMRTAEAALQREGTEGHIVMAGNTTATDGCLYEAIVTRRHMWKPYEVTADPDDPRRTSRIDIEYCRQQIKEFGRDNPFVMINILAKFPTQGVNQLISADQVRECIGRHLHQKAYDYAPKIIGADIADMGDDRTVFFPRQGLAYFKPTVLRNMDPVFIAGHLGQLCTSWGAQSIQMDASGGYGAGPIAILRDQGFTVLPVYGSGEPLDRKFFNKRSECMWNACENIKMGASLPSECDELVGELAAITYGYKGDRIILEPKALIKARIGRSPDLADALGYSHAFPVGSTSDTRAALFPFDLERQFNRSKVEYDPLTRE